MNNIISQPEDDYPIEAENEDSGLPSPSANSEDKTTEALGSIVLDMAIKLQRNRKTPLSEKANILSKLVKAHSDLVKSRRTINPESVRINAGVILIPGKSEDWENAAKRELDRAQNLINPPSPSPSEEP